MDAVIHWIENPMEQERARLAQGLRGGDPDVLDDLIERHQHRLFRYLLSLTGNRATAEDVFQETWLRVLERGHQYRAQWSFEGWLFSIARHLVIDWARRKKPQSLDELMDTGDPRAAAAVSETHSAFEERSRDEESAQVSAALQQLPAAF